MKKLIFDNIIFSLQSSGGISVVWFNLLQHLVEQRQFKFKCLEYPNALGNIFRKQLSLFSEDLDQRSPMCLSVERYKHPLVLEGDEPFIFHSSYYRTCRNKRALNITTVHDFTYEYYRKGLTKNIHCWQKYQAIRNAHLIVCITENTKKDLLKFLPDIDSKKIHVIYNGVSEDYHPLGSIAFPEYSNFILYVGARDSYKNFTFIVESLKETKFNLLVCGKPLLKEELNYLDRSLGRFRYKVLKNVSNETLNKIYNSVYCLAYPSSYEGFGIPVVEAQKAGCPVIAMNVSSIPEIIGQTPLLMDVLSKEEFIRNINLLKDPIVRKNVIELGLNNSKRFSWKKMFLEYMSLYSQC